MDFKNYFKELKRRNVFKAAIAYLVVSWIVIQVISILFPLFKIPGAFQKGIVIILAVGFPVWLIFAWIYELTPDGLKKTEKVAQERSITHETSNKFNKIIIGALVVAIILLGANLYSNYTKNDEKPQANVTANNNSETTDKEEKSIAVLAFDDMSPKKDQEYFSDGISEEILNYLAKNPDLEVISRTSSFYFKDKEATTKEIGQKLHVNYLLEGSVRKAGDMVRITAQLINISTGIHIWSETYDRKLDDIFKIQDDIAAAVSKKLEASLLGEKISETNTKAYTLYLQAKHLYNLRTEESMKKALELLKQATNIDSKYAPSWALMSGIYRFLGYNASALPHEKAYELGTKAAKKAIEIDPSYAKGYMGLANFNLAQFDFKKAKQNTEKALQLAPNDPVVLSRSGMMTFSSILKMIENTKKSMKLDPLYYPNYYNLGLLYYWEGNNQKALEYFDQYEEYQPGAMGLNYLKTLALLAEGRTQEALATIEKEPYPFFKAYGKIKSLYQAGKKEEASALFKDLRKNYPKEAANIADIYAFMGNREKTFEWLEKAVKIKDPTITEAVYYPTFNKFHDDPRWQQLLEEMGVPEDNGIPGYKN
ncbi:hypothetical protein C7S20_10695 [Christiangramia fulva]|uniref:Uncharacterized protein n=1 Tax=Christiangramia fulva TaxID=2126553 RepID=A0A2R3Z5Z8_9FLAO|nr:tetratricopeptide repeat protein [Christiangramia fulva]AVR45685.1 hypothetical protein C7S20_10695 [Christiangramia fulva]